MRFPPGNFSVHARIAQGIEQRFPKPLVAGSNPVPGAILSLHLRNLPAGQPVRFLHKNSVFFNCIPLKLTEDVVHYF